MTFEIIQMNYNRGLWNKAQVQVAVTKGVITQEQADAIYEGKPDPTAGDTEAAVEQALQEAVDILKGVTK